jgi:hypothetical protein
MSTREILTPARQSALVLATALGAVYTVGGLWQAVSFLLVAGLLVMAWAWCAMGGEADADADYAVRTRGVWS